MSVPPQYPQTLSGCGGRLRLRAAPAMVKQISMRQAARALLVSAAFAILVGCGGGPAGSDGPAAVRTGVFVDGLVQGVTYKSSSGLNGVTGSRGEYQYREGDRISFYVGSVLLGEFTAEEVVSVLDAANPAEVALFLQALDADGNAANGILIPAALANRFNGSGLKIEEVVPGEPGFEAAFLAFSGKPFSGNAQIALEHASHAAMQQLLGGSVLWQYYGGDISLDLTGYYNTAALDSQARHRLNLYAYRYFVYPQLQIKQQMLIAGSSFVMKLNQRNQETAKEIGFVAGAAFAVGAGVLEDQAVAPVLNKTVFATAAAVKDAVASEVYGHALDQVNNTAAGGTLTQAGGAFLHRFASGVWGCKGAMTMKVSEVGGCVIELSTQAYNTFSNGFTVFKLSSNTEKLHTLMVADAYLDSYYRRAGDLAAVNQEFGLPRTTSYRDLLAALPVKLGAKNADLPSATQLIELHQLEVMDSVNTLVQNLGLDSAMPKGKALAPENFQASFVPGSARVQDGKLALCFDLRNHLVATDLNLRVTVSDSTYSQANGQVFQASYPLSRRASARHCATLDRPLDLASGDVLALGLSVVDTGSGQSRTDALIVSLLELQQDLAQLKGLTVPDFATEVLASAPDMPEDGLVYGVNFFRIGLDATSKARLGSELPGATYAWREIVFAGAASLGFYAGYDHQQEAIVKFPKLAPGASRSYFLELKISNPVSGLFKTFITRVDLSHVETKVTSITPVSAPLHTPTVFTVRGQGFPLEMTAQIQGADCTANKKVRLSSTEYQLTCQHARAESRPLTVVANPGGAMLTGGTQAILFNSIPAGTLPHTGVSANKCYEAGSDTVVACDSESALALNSQQDGHRRGVGAMSYSLVQASAGGSYTKSECVKDDVTGLVWEAKRDGTLRSSLTTYNNFDDSTAAQKWDASSASHVRPTEAEIGSISNSKGYVAWVNSQSLCGFSDWRLPSVLELQTLVNFDRLRPAINTEWFSQTASSFYWASNTVSEQAEKGWYVDFWSGDAKPYARSNKAFVRLVRGPQFGRVAQRHIIRDAPYEGDAPNNAVLDTATGLLWRRCLEGQAWTGSACRNESSGFTHESALSHASRVAQWRIPHAKELASLADTGDQRIDTSLFVGSAQGGYYLWSSTPLAQPQANIWQVWLLGVPSGSGAALMPERRSAGDGRVRLVFAVEPGI